MRQAESAPYQNVQVSNKENAEPIEITEKSRSNSLSKSKFLNKFRRSMSSINVEPSNDTTQTLPNKPKSTFYLTDTIEVDSNSEVPKPKVEISNSVSPIILRNPKISQRPQSPPPPIPVDANQNIGK